MRQILLLYSLIGTTFMFADEDFISHYEYGEMLYNNPRGVSCAQCHGKSGEGTKIVEFRDIHGKQAITGPDIRKEPLSRMINSINHYHEIMPRYYLTDEEVEAIYDYLKEKNRRYPSQPKETNSTQ